MRAGRLDRYVAIYSFTKTRNSFGEDIPAESLVTNAWCEKREVQGNERWVSKQYLAEVEAVFVTHYIQGIGAKMILRYEGQDYDILGVVEIGRREGIAISCKRRGD